MGTVALLMLLPAGVLMITFLIIPIGLTFVLAFTNARLISPEPARVRRRPELRPDLQQRDLLGLSPQHHHLRRGDRAGAVGHRAWAWPC